MREINYVLIIIVAVENANLEIMFIKLYFWHVKLTDFGIARYLKFDNKLETSGTLGYMGK